MFTTTDKDGKNNNIWIDKELFYDIDESNVDTEEQHFMVLAMIGLIMVARGETYIFTTPEIILATMCNDEEPKLKPKVVKGFISGLNKLNEIELITINKEVTKVGQMIKVDTSKLTHDGECSFFQISKEEVEVAMQSSTPQHILTLFSDMASRWNMSSYKLYEEEGWDYDKRYEYDGGFKLYKYLSCYPTLDELTTTWCSRPNEVGEVGFNCIERSVKWDVGERTIKGYIKEMVDLGLICRVTKNMDMRNHNYYCRPQHYKCVCEVLDVLDEQKAYMNEKGEDM